MKPVVLRDLLNPRVPDEALCANPGVESSYRHLFLRDLARLGLEDDYYPVGGAANYSLLYLIQRIATRFRPPRVLDVGCGQTTRLWSRLRGKGLVGEVLTLENDAGWAQEIGREVDHAILVSELTPSVIASGVVDTYDWSAARSRGPFDVIGVDGPLGTARRSRAGVLSLLDDALPQDFILFMDDCERSGEQETLGLIHDRLRAMGRDYAAGAIQAAKTQVVFAAGAYRGAVYF